MIKYLKHSQIDKGKWDECIKHSFNKNIYANSWYLDAVCENWEALVDGHYSAVMPLTWNKKYGINYLYQPFFTQQLGIFSTEDNLPNRKTEEFLIAIPYHFRYIEINLNLNNPFLDINYKASSGVTHLLDLNRTYEEIYKGYNLNCKRNIAKAHTFELKVVKDISVAEIIRLFKSNKGKEITDFKDKQYSILMKLCDSMLQHAILNNIGIVNNEGNLIAGAIFPEYSNQAVFLFSGLSAEGRKASAMSFLIDLFIHEHAGKDLMLDFEGSINSNLARFYKSFGSNERTFLKINRNLLPRPIKWLKK